MNFEQPNIEDKSTEKPKGLIDNIRSKVQGIVEETRLPTKENLGYDSTVGVYGGKLNHDEEGRMVFDMRGVVSKIDRFGDAILRTYDEHTAKNPMELLKKHPKLFYRFLFAGPKRYRGTPEEINENIERLGLADNYGLHPWGIEIKDQSLFTSSRPLQDIYRSDLIGEDNLEQIDRFDSLAKAAQYVHEVHQDRGAIGELLPSDIIFRPNDSGESEPVLNIPDIVFNKEKDTAEIDKKTTDLLDFTVSIGLEELRRSGDWNEAQRAIRVIIDNYNDAAVINMLKSYVVRGRLTMMGDEKFVGLAKASEKVRPLTSIHNKARLSFKKELTENLRELIVAECEDYLSALNQPEK